MRIFDQYKCLVAASTSWMEVHCQVTDGLGAPHIASQTPLQNPISDLIGQITGPPPTLAVADRNRCADARSLSKKEAGKFAKSVKHHTARLNLLGVSARYLVGRFACPYRGDSATCGYYIWRKAKESFIHCQLGTNMIL
jgi:hypothetical protein